MNLLSLSFDGVSEDIPFDKVLKRRLVFGAALGYLFFDRGSGSAIEGYTKAVPLLKDIFSTLLWKNLDGCILELKKIVRMPGFIFSNL